MVNIASTVMVGKNLNFTLKSTNDIHVPYKNAKMCIAQNFINLKNEENLDHSLSIFLGAVQQFSLQAYLIHEVFRLQAYLTTLSSWFIK